MFRRVEAQIVLSGISKKELARQLGIGYNTLLVKMRGESEFTLKEALAIKAAIHSSEPLELLFGELADIA